MNEAHKEQELYKLDLVQLQIERSHRFTSLSSGNTAGSKADGIQPLRVALKGGITIGDVDIFEGKIRPQNDV